VRLLYLCPDYAPPAGGIRVIYRHVDILRRNGYDAYVVHERQGFRCRWFENDTPILAWSSRRSGRDASAVRRAARHVRRGLRNVPPDRLFLHLHEQPALGLRADDVVVIPEMFGPHLASIAPGNAKVIFNQNAYFTFKGYAAASADVEFPYRHPEVVATLVVSDDSQRLLQYAFPGLRTYRVRWSLDIRRFTLETRKSRQIAYMPRRGAADAVHVISTLRARGALDAYDVAPLEGLSEAEVAHALRSSLVFLSLGYHEGLPLPPAEAMACGAIVVGYDGFGGREFMLQDLAFPVPAGDLRHFAETLEHVLRLDATRPDELRERARRAAAFVAQTYAPAREEEDLLAAWSGVVKSLRP
jgi:hypothetical protein